MRKATALEPATTADTTAIRELTRAAYAKRVQVTGRKPQPLGANHAKTLRRHRFDLLYAGQTLAALIENLAAAPVFQGRGLGRRPLAHAEGLAVAAGLGMTRLHTNMLFEANLRLHARLGYRLDCEKEMDGGIAVHMSLKVPTQIQTRENSR